MVLTAALAISYQVPIPVTAKPVVIVLLGVAAFYLSLTIARSSSYARRRSRT